jgi:hypothetical protein
MPQLPSGRHIALSPGVIDHFLDQARKGKDDKGLLRVRTVIDLFPFIRVTYFRERTPDDSLAEGEVVPGSAPFPPGLVSYDSGLNLSSFRDEVLKWDEGDRNAFLDFLETKMWPYFEEKLLEIENCRKLSRYRKDSF